VSARNCTLVIFVACIDACLCQAFDKISSVYQKIKYFLVDRSIYLDAGLWPGPGSRSCPALGGGGYGLCCAPCVDHGFWLSFALRCVALLCAVYVRLHLVLFAAGRLFLSPLSGKMHCSIRSLLFCVVVVVVVDTRICMCTNVLGRPASQLRHVRRLAWPHVS
jgi:hypothetical protein